LEPAAAVVLVLGKLLQLHDLAAEAVLEVE
jgi:hypothetical protein